MADGKVILGIGALGAAALVIAHHRKASAAQSPSLPPAPVPSPLPAPTMTPAIAGLPEPLASAARAVLSNPMATSAQYEELARQLTSAGYLGAATDILKQIPNAENPGGEDTSGVLYATNPSYQWTVQARPGDSPALIAKIITGDWRRYPELLAANPGKPTNGKPFPQLNWVSLTVGERIKAPRSWDPWIAQDGTPARSTTPFPSNPSGYEPGKP